jgi:hypothetical protein
MLRTILFLDATHGNDETAGMLIFDSKDGGIVRHAVDIIDGKYSKAFLVEGDSLRFLGANLDANAAIEAALGAPHCPDCGGEHCIRAEDFSAKCSLQSE